MCRTFKWSSFILVAIATASLSVPNAAAQIVVSEDDDTNLREIRRVVVVNGKLTLGAFFALNPDCTMIGRATIRVLAEPQNGTVRSANDMGFPAYGKDNLRYECGKKRASGVSISYEPKRQFAGEDSVTIEVIYPMGTSRKLKYLIEVK